MPKMLLTGGNSAIVKALIPLLDCEYLALSREFCDMGSVADVDAAKPIILRNNRIVIAHGNLSNKYFLERDEHSLLESIKVNLLSVVRLCEIALTDNCYARIVVIGSESAKGGSYDVAYWLSKAALHAYVRERRLCSPYQQLVCIAPSLILGTGMTDRKSQDEIEKSISQNPKQRGIMAAEVAELIRFLLFTEKGYITNTVVEMNGGKFARRA